MYLGLADWAPGEKTGRETHPSREEDTETDSMPTLLEDAWLSSKQELPLRGLAEAPKLGSFPDLLRDPVH